MGLAELVALCYALGSIGSALGLSGVFRSLRKPAAWLLATGFALHTVTIAHILAAEGMDGLTKGALLQIMAWSLVFVYCVTWWRLQFTVLGIMAGPLALALFLASSTVSDVQGGVPATMTGAFVLLHLAVLFLNLALVTLGMGSALYFLNLHRKLKAKAILPAADDDNTPALSTVDRVNRLIVLVGFPLFTIGLLTGFAKAQIVRGAILSADPKEILSVLLWLLYAYIFVQRVIFAQNGRKAALMLLALFCAMLLSLVGVNFFMDSHHNFFQPRIF